jgi:hypothetical protein
LLAGEHLQYDLRRLETAYLEQNKREFELTKHLSLLLLDPLALVELRESGQCYFSLPEEIFDLDYPGHYFRRIKSVSLTLPCVVEPYTAISCTLRQVKNSIRINTSDSENYPPQPADPRFIENNIPVNAIATSNGQNDSGIFELNFRDERYLPFEGAGVISEWSLELFSDLPSNNPDPALPDFGRPLRQFDYGTISDVILHIKYTAREDSGPFKSRAIKHLREYFSLDGTVSSYRMFNLRQEFLTEWHRFLHPSNPANGNLFEVDMSNDLFNYRDHDKTLKINSITLLARCTKSGDYTVVLNPPLPGGSDTFQISKAADIYGGLHFHEVPDVDNLGIELSPTDLPVKWQLKMTNPNGENLEEDPIYGGMEVSDVLVVLGYEWN